MYVCVSWCCAFFPCKQMLHYWQDESISFGHKSCACVLFIVCVAVNKREMKCAKMNVQQGVAWYLTNFTSCDILQQKKNLTSLLVSAVPINNSNMHIVFPNLVNVATHYDKLKSPSRASGANKEKNESEQCEQNTLKKKFYTCWHKWTDCLRRSFESFYCTKKKLNMPSCKNKDVNLSVINYKSSVTWHQRAAHYYVLFQFESLIKIWISKNG